MRTNLFLLIVISVILFSVFVKASQKDTVTINLNSSTSWWDDPVLASGSAIYLNGSGIANSNLILSISGTTYCSNTTDSNGNWTCVFNAPISLGNYEVMVNVTNSTGSSTTNSTTLSVAPTFGVLPIGTVQRVAFQVPALIQDFDGSIRSAFVVVTTWKGS